MNYTNYTNYIFFAIIFYIFFYKRRKENLNEDLCDENDLEYGDCGTLGSTYKWIENKTVRDDPCLNWNDVLDLNNNSDKEYYKQRSIGNHNYCRNPDCDKKPWCFIKDTGRGNWDYCNVDKVCPQKEVS